MVPLNLIGFIVYKSLIASIIRDS
jgi:hypothetical protein